MAAVPGRNTRAYQAARAAVLATSTMCWLCGHDGAGSVDHEPPLKELRARPYCGLPATATAEILNARERHANAELTSKYEEAVKRIGRLEAERNSLRAALDEIRATLRDHDERMSA